MPRKDLSAEAGWGGLQGEQAVHVQAGPQAQSHTPKVGAIPSSSLFRAEDMEAGAAYLEPRKYKGFCRQTPNSGPTAGGRQPQRPKAGIRPEHKASSPCTVYVPGTSDLRMGTRDHAASTGAPSQVRRAQPGAQAGRLNGRLRQ